MSLTVSAKPCWEVVCDGCGEGDNREYGGSFHYPSEAAARQEIEGADWLVRTDGKALCADCCEDAWKHAACPVCGVPIDVRCPHPDGGPKPVPCLERVEAALTALDDKQP